MSAALALAAGSGTRPLHVVFGRGGIRGIAMAGAAAAFGRAGWRIERASGISVGGIVAALVATGHTPDELRRVVFELDYAAMRDRRGLAGRVPGIGPLWSLVTRLGCYEGDALENALRDVLVRKGVRAFADLRAPGTRTAPGRYRLQVLCADVTRGRLVVLPDDAVRYGLDPDRLDVARALRMSASLPFFFRPVRFGTRGGSLILDGGLVAGIPYRLFHATRCGGWTTLGVQAGPAPGRRPAVTGPVSLLRAAYYTALRANQETQDDGAAAATIDIDCGPVGAIDFRLSDPQKQALFDAGVDAARRFLQLDHARSRRDAPVAPQWAETHLFVAGG